eukprot:scaffold110236_cov40-Cyclotella_meneghiniana.AAC.3
MFDSIASIYWFHCVTFAAGLDPIAVQVFQVHYSILPTYDSSSNVCAIIKLFDWTTLSVLNLWLKSQASSNWSSHVKKMIDIKIYMSALVIEELRTFPADSAMQIQTAGGSFASEQQLVY